MEKLYREQIFEYKISYVLRKYFDKHDLSHYSSKINIKYKYV